MILIKVENKVTICRSYNLFFFGNSINAKSYGNDRLLLSARAIVTMIIEKNLDNGESPNAAGYGGFEKTLKAKAALTVHYKLPLSRPVANIRRIYISVDLSNNFKRSCRSIRSLWRNVWKLAKVIPRNCYEKIIIETILFREYQQNLL